MRYVYYGYGKKDKVGWGLLQDDDETIIEGSGDPWRNFRPDKSQTDISEVRLFRPLVPGQIFEIDKTATLVKAPPRTFGPNDKVIFPRRVRQVAAIGRLGIVIGQTTKQVTPAQAKSSILGYTGVIEFNARNLHKSEIGCAFGPAIAVGLDFTELEMQLLVNSRVVCSGKISHDIAIDVSQASQQHTLLAGDVIISGGLSGDDFQTGLLFPGDVIQLVIGKIGKLNLLCGSTR